MSLLPCYSLYLKIFLFTKDLAIAFVLPCAANL